MSDTDSIHFTCQVSAGDTYGDPPSVRVLPNGRLQIYPGGTDVCLFVTPADWRKLNAAVEAVILATPEQVIA